MKKILYKLPLVLVIFLVVVLLDYIRVSCCDTGFGCQKCNSYLSHYGIK